jgi:hypothetical protein
MFVRFIGGGVGHKATEHIQPPDLHVFTRDTEAKTQEKDTHPFNECTLEEGEDSEALELDEEAVYGYGDTDNSSVDSEGSDRGGDRSQDNSEVTDNDGYDKL